MASRNQLRNSRVDCGNESSHSDFTSTSSALISPNQYASSNSGGGKLNTSYVMNQPSNTINWNEESNSGWTGTGVMSDRSSVYSIDDGDFDREASRKVNNQLRQIESILYEQNSTHSSNQLECMEWLEKFPHIRILGKQLSTPSSQSDLQLSLDSLKSSMQSSLRNLSSNFFEHNKITSRSFRHILKRFRGNYYLGTSDHT